MFIILGFEFIISYILSKSLITSAPWRLSIRLNFILRKKYAFKLIYFSLQKWLIINQNTIKLKEKKNNFYV